MPFPDPSHSFLSLFLSLREHGVWGVRGTLPSYLVSPPVLFLVLPGSEDGDEEREKTGLSSSLPS